LTHAKVPNQVLTAHIVTLLLGFPTTGSAQLTRRLLDSLDIDPGDRLVDVACGVGATSLLAAQE
jgi:hypothetical protein